MNFKNLLLLAVLCIYAPFCTAQDMQQGFTMLENGNFGEAETFFGKILEEHPDNKTALLCYGRATGLNGSPQQATHIFEDLIQTYPGDLEVQLNFAESLLWNKDYEAAKTYYAELVSKNPDNFGALLGYANTLSNLKEYEAALTTVNQALQVDKDNPSAKISRKYIRLGYANSFLQDRNYDDALTFLDENLLDFPADKETLLNKANLYLIVKDAEAAKQVYEQLALNRNDSIMAFNGISLAAHIAENEKEALQYARQARELSQHSSDSLKILEAEERYVQALIWNGKFNTAENHLENLTAAYGDALKILALKATLGMYTGSFKKSINNYKQILDQDSTSFDGNLGIANAYFARGEAKKAKISAENTLQFYKNQQDAEQFLKKLSTTFAPVLEEDLNYSFDNGNNEAFATTTRLKVPLSTRLELFGAYTYRKTRNSLTLLEASSDQVNLAASYMLAPNFKIKANGGLIKATSDVTDYTNLVGEIGLQAKPFNRDDLEIGFRRDLQDFNAELLNRKIAGNHFILNNNYSTPYGLGWYLQFFHTEQSDNNRRELLFTSFYYSFLKKPLLKGGINYQYISFKEQMPEFYFSPERFQAAEIFLSLVRSDPAKSLSYELTGATGYQFIERQTKQSTYRLLAKMGYALSDRFSAGIYGNHSNIASATAAGFTFTQFGVNLTWLIAKNPIFRF